MNKKIVLGFIFLMITSTAFYVTLPGQVKFRLDADKSTFYVLNDNNRWEVSGREYNNLYEGSSKLNRKASNITYDYDIEGNVTTITRRTPYIKGPLIVDTYTFDGGLEDITKFPLTHTVRIVNGSGLIYQYEVRDLEYDGVSRRVYENSMSFGKNMKVEWDQANYWARVYSSGILKARWRVTSDDKLVRVRLFDPPPVALQSNATYQLHPSLSNLTYAVNFSLIDVNFTDVILNQKGNYTWNFSENVTRFVLNETTVSTVPWVFNITNNGTLNITVNMTQNQTKPWYEWWCNNFNITNVSRNVINVSNMSSSVFNCTLNLVNISQTYVNWTLNVSKSDWDFTYAFTYANVT